MLFDGILKDMILFPELLNLILALYEVHVCINFFKHQRLISLNHILNRNSAASFAVFKRDFPMF